MQKLVIAIDCDDVLVASAEKAIKAYNSEHGTDLDISEFYSRDISRWQVNDYKEATLRVRRIFTEILSENLVPDVTTVRIIKDLAKNNELHLVTGRDDTFKPMTEAMVKKYFPYCFKSIEHTNHFNEKKRTKGEVCVDLGADILVDDHVEHIQDVISAGLNKVIVFGNYPWNNVALPDSAIRCVDWYAVQKEVTRIASA